MRTVYYGHTPIAILVFMETWHEFLFTKVASTEGFLLMVGALLLVFLVRKNIRDAVALFASAAGLILATQLFKEAFQVPRPIESLIEVTGYAFPSGHAAGSAFLALVVAFLVRKQSKPVRYLVVALAVLIALLVGMSRVMYQVHTPFQVLAGFGIGLAFAGLFMWVSSKRRVLP